jgi:hypothetical protein
MNPLPRSGVTILFLLAVVMSGCVPVGRYWVGEEGWRDSPEKPVESSHVTLEQAIKNAQRYLETNPNWKIDCSHFVLTCYQDAEMNDFLNRRKYHHNLVYDLNYYLTQKKTRRKKAADIQPGDIIIFCKTYDINRDGHSDDKDVFTHAGIVESFKDWLVTYIDASEGRNPPRIKRRSFSFYPKTRAESGRVAVDPATGREILHKETFYAAYAAP